MTTGNVPVKTIPTSVLLGQLCARMLSSETLIVALFGPVVGLLIWLLPLAINPTAHLALAIVGFMIVYWVSEPIEPGMTAIIGCFLFWALHVAPSTVAFSGFTAITPWYVFGSICFSMVVSALWPVASSRNKQACSC